MMEPLSPRTTAFFWSQVQIETANGCWVWRGYTKGNGYGYFGKRHWRVHRLAYLLLVGPIQEGLTIDHLCKNRLCVNTEHMEVVSFGVNTLRGNGWSGTNARKAVCHLGHPFRTRTSRRTGRLYRLCPVCHLEGNRLWRLKKKEAALANTGRVTA